MPFELLSWLRGQVGTFELPVCDTQIEQRHADDPREWLVTNGLGSYASANLWGANTRRYHGLLVASNDPPVGRTVLLSRVDETASFAGDEKTYQLATNFWKDGAVSPQGFERISKFAVYPSPTWMYELPHGLLIKQVVMPYFKQRVVIGYTWLTPEAPKGNGKSIDLKLDLIVDNRSFHHETQGSNEKKFDQKFSDTILRLTSKKGRAASPEELFVHIDKGTYQVQPEWYLNYHWPREAERGLAAESDAYRSGSIEVTLKPHESITIIASADPLADERWMDINDYVRNDWTRRNAVLKKADFVAVPEERKLVLAADQFIVKRDSTRGASMLAGYHWFGDWGRDALVSLPGLALNTGRFEEARSILGTLAKYFSEGMLPNFFPEGGGDPEYNSSDVTLWWATSLFRYYQKTGDVHFVRAQLPFLEATVKALDQGTRHGLRFDHEDALVTADDGQITWMDARVDGKPVTPRAGKCVEINALWYNFIKIIEILNIAAGGQVDDPEGKGLVLSNRKAQKYGELADKVRASFEKFWNPERNCLYDRLAEDGPDASLRPNQLLAASLPFPVISQEKAKTMLEVVERELLTPFGLRTLEPGDMRYAKSYGWGKDSASSADRDSTYHQGTVWPWLLGAWVDARFYSYGNDHKNRRFVTEHLRPLLKHFDSAACLGSISEIFDADPPHAPRGCVAQAWSLGELLRVVAEHRLLQDVVDTRSLTGK